MIEEEEGSSMNDFVDERRVDKEGIPACVL
jgi:hypothetical protein